MKREAIPRAANLISMPLAQLAYGNGPFAPAILMGRNAMILSELDQSYKGILPILAEWRSEFAVASHQASCKWGSAAVALTCSINVRQRDT